MDKPEAKGTTRFNGKPLLVATLLVVLLLGGVAFLLEFLLKPSFIVSWPELTVRGGEAVVRFDVENRSKEPLSLPVRISLLDHTAGRSHGIKVTDSLAEKRATLEVPAQETKEYEYTFPLKERVPTMAMVEQVKQLKEDEK